MNNNKKVKIIALTKPVLEEIENGEDLVAFVARVSNPENQLNTETSKKLLKYLKKNKHWSPFEMVNCVMEINTTRDIARQILRHRSFSFQEYSGRYQTYDKLPELTEFREARLQDTKNRQNSIETEDEDLQNEWDEMQEVVQRNALNAYQWALEKGIAKEQARTVLPEGLTPSRLYVNGTLRSWIHYCELRMGNGTQKEHREIAELCWKELLKHFPSLLED